MSKSKLNKRQLKKISKTAVEYLIRAKKGWMTGITWDDVSFGENEDDCDEYVVWYRCSYWGEEYDNNPAITIVFDNFYEEFTDWGGCDIYSSPDINLPIGFSSLSFTNQIHYMIRFLEVANDK